MPTFWDSFPGLLDELSEQDSETFEMAAGDICGGTAASASPSGS